LNPSAHVADIGAGTGFFTFRLAELVPHGRVYAVEVQSALVDTLNARAHRGGWRNVFPIQGTVDNPSLPDARIDLVLIVSSYHEFSQPEAMMRRIFQAIRPGGTLVIVEYRKEDATIPIEEHHRMTAEQIRREMEAVGFTWKANREILPQQHVVVFQRPV
jgi:ubiquinone/menaquinone biosynthesis C-methylase UbiE